jgi:hypothetical protein
MLKGAGKGRE